MASARRDQAFIAVSSQTKQLIDAIAKHEDRTRTAVVTRQVVRYAREQVDSNPELKPFIPK
jgi:predicted transcriptional regulator